MESDAIEADVEVEVEVDVEVKAPPKKGRSRSGRKAAGARAPSGALERFDPLRAYMEEVRRYPLLTPQEEHDIAAHYRETNDPKHAHRLVTANLRLVVKIANEYRSHWTNLLDLVQEGNIGLMQAVKRYDPFRGVRLSSYAQYWIRAYIIYYLLSNFRLVKIGTTQAQRKLFFRLQKARDKFIAMGINPGAKLLAEKLDVTEKDVQQMSIRLDSPELSIDATPPGGEGPTLSASLPSGADGPEADVIAAQIRERLSDALRRFGETLEDEREQALWNDRLLSDSPATLQEIGTQFGVSRERARQLEERLKRRCKDFLTDELGTDIKLAFLD